MQYKDYHRSLLAIGLALLIVAGLVLWVWLAAGADGNVCMSSVVIGRDPQPVRCLVWLPEVHR